MTWDGSPSRRTHAGPAFSREPPLVREGGGRWEADSTGPRGTSSRTPAVLSSYVLGRVQYVPPLPLLLLHHHPPPPPPLPPVFSLLDESPHLKNRPFHHSDHDSFLEILKMGSIATLASPS